MLVTDTAMQDIVYILPLRLIVASEINVNK